MLDFTSSLYLGMRHPSRALEPWESLTIGAPAALSEPEEFRRVAQEVARLQGCEAGVLGTSTLHVFWDLFGVLAGEPLALLVDGGAYPIAGWGVERARARGARVRSFPHHDPQALRALVANRPPGRRPVVVCDGVCPACGEVAPVEEYLDAVVRCGGLLVIDDTQALGVLGAVPTTEAPYGRGGGGTLRWSGVSNPSVLLVASLAKGFGAPLAVVSGSGAMIARYTALSQTRVHCSPPSVAAVRGAQRALALNRERGDCLRLGLWRTVTRFRRGVRDFGMLLHPGAFPFQTLCAGDAGRLHERLFGAGIRTVLHRPRTGSGARISFLFTARHTADMVDRALWAIGEAGPEA